jgi:hypothetical protein
MLLSPEMIGNRRTIFNNLLIDENYYWVGSNNGLFLYEKGTGKHHYFSHSSENPTSLSHNNIISIYKSTDGVIWFGTYGGINKIENIKGNFSLVQYDPNLKNTLSQKIVGPILEDKNGIVWAGTPNGLNAYNRATNENIIFKNIQGKSNSLSSNYILSIYQDRLGNIWVGTRGGGLNKFKYKNINDLKNISFERIELPSLAKSSNRVQSIFEDSNGTLWIGTGGIGLIKYDPESKETRLFSPRLDGTGPSHPYVYCMFEDNKGNYWIGTPTGGLNLLNRETDEFLFIKNNPADPQSLSNDIILSIFQDRNENLWVGTSGGLNKLNIPVEKNMFEKIKDSLITVSFARYGRSQGLPNEVIYGILDDDNGFLWFSTNAGLVKFDPAAPRPVLKTFDMMDGLQNNEFNQNSFWKNNKGEMYFGGISGFNIFHPDSIKPNPYIPPVRFTDFKLFNESVPLKNQNKSDLFSLDKSFYLTESLELSYSQNVITFDFAALNYIIPEKNNYAYMMEGFDLDWILAGNRRTVTYTNLDPGNYTFRVRGSNNDGIWNEQGAAVTLYISPPPWLSWYAYIFYAAVFFGALLAYVRFRIKAATKELETQAKIERAKIEEREEVRKKSSADFHDEAGNKLTKISLFTELARNEAAAESFIAGIFK